VIDAVGSSERFAHIQAQRKIGEGIEFQGSIVAGLDQIDQGIVAARARGIGLPKVEDVDLRFFAGPVAERLHLTPHGPILCFQERDIAVGALGFFRQGMQPEILLKPFAVVRQDQTRQKWKYKCHHQHWRPPHQPVERQTGRK